MVTDLGLSELALIGAEIDRIIADRATGQPATKGAIAALVERLARLDDETVLIHPPIARTPIGYAW